MVAGGSVELDVILNLKKIEQDAKKAEKLIEQALNDRTVRVDVDTGNAVSEVLGIGDAAKKAADDTREIGVAARSLDSIFEGVGQSIGQTLIEALQNAIGLVRELTSDAIRTGASFEQLEEALKGALGEQEGSQALAQIQEFAANTPEQVDTLTESFIKLTNRGFRPSIEELTNLGDLAASQTKEIDQLAEALLDAEVGQFERLLEFGIRAERANGQVTLSFRDLQETVADTPEAIRGVLLGFGQLEGIAGSLERQAATTAGRLSNLQDAGDQVAVTFFRSVKPALDAALEVLSQLLGDISGDDLFGSLADSAQNFADALETNPELIERISTAVQELAGILVQVSAAVLDLGADFANTEASISSLDSAIELLRNLALTIDLITSSVRAAVQVVAPFLDNTLSLIGSVFQVVRQAREAIDAVLDRIGVLAQNLDNVPIVGRFFENGAVGQLIDARDQVQALGDDLSALGQAGLEEANQQSTDSFLDNARRREQNQSSGTNGTNYQAELAELENALAAQEAVLRESGASEEQIRAQLLANEQQFLRDRVTINQQAVTELRQQLAAGLGAEEVERVNAEILQIERAISADRITLAQNTAQAQEAAATEALEAVERANAEANRAILRSQQERVVAVREQQLAGVLNEEQAAQEIEAIARSTTNAQIAESERQLSEVSRLRDEGVLTAEEASNRETELQGQIQDATLQRLEDEIAARQEAADRALEITLDLIERELDAFEAQQQERIRILSRQSAELSNQNDLLSSQQNLQQALFDLDNQSLQASIDRAENEGRSADAARLRLDLRRQEGRQLEATQAAERQALAIQQRQTELTLRREAAEARIAEARARSAVQTAIENGESEERIALLREELAAAQDLSAVVRDQQATLAQTNDIDQAAQIANQIRDRRELLMDEANELRQSGREGGLSRGMRNRLQEIDRELQAPPSLPAFSDMQRSPAQDITQMLRNVPSPAQIQPELPAMGAGFQVELGAIAGNVQRIADFLPQMDRQMNNVFHIESNSGQQSAEQVLAELERAKLRQRGG
ncbi:MAG: hypothetical protein AAFX78_05040 [Cyanobacteria bacterium J06638_20]